MGDPLKVTGVAVCLGHHPGTLEAMLVVHGVCRKSRQYDGDYRSSDPEPLSELLKIEEGFERLGTG